MPRTGTTLCHPQNCLCRFDTQLSSRHLALNSPLDHFNGDNAYSPPQKYQTHETHGDIQSSFLPTATWLSLNYDEHNPSHVRRHTLPSQPSQPSHKSILSPCRLFTHNLSTSPAAQAQTTFSMLQIKTHFDYRHLTFHLSFIHSQHLARKQHNVNTHTYVTTFSSLTLTITISPR